MATKKRRRFDREYKLEAVRLALGSGKPQIEVARDLGLNPKTLYRWVHEFRGGRDSSSVAGANYSTDLSLKDGTNYGEEDTDVSGRQSVDSRNRPKCRTVE